MLSGRRRACERGSRPCWRKRQPPAARRPRRRSRRTRFRRLMPVDPEVARRHAAERPALLRARERQARHAGPNCGSSSRPVRCSKTTTSAGWRISSSTWSSKARSTFPSRASFGFLSSLGLSIGPDANAATSYDDTQYTLRVPTDVPGVLDRALLVLEDWAHGATFDQDAHRARARHRAVGVAHAPRRRRADAGQDPPRAARRIALRGSAADRRPRDHRARAARAAGAVLPRLVPSRSDGGDRRRRRRSRRRRGDDQGALFSALTSPSPERPRPTFDVPEHPRHALRRRHRQGNDRDGGRAQRPSPGAQSGLGRRLSRHHARPAVRRTCSATGSTSSRQSANAPFLRAAADRELFPIARTQRRSAISRRSSRTTASRRGLDALVTELQRVARFGFTATELDRAKQAMMLGSERVVTESPDRSPRAAPTSTRATFSRTKRCRPSGRSSRFIAGSFRMSRSRGQRARPRLVSRAQPAGRRLRAGSGPASSCPIEAQLAAVVKTATAKRLERYVDAAAGQTLMDAPPTRGTIVKTTTTRSEAGITEWTLSNGATVVLEADDAEGGSDSVPRDRAGRHVAGERRRFHSRARRRHASFRPAASASSTR